MMVCFFAVGDGRNGYPSEAPFDAIHVGAAAPSLPEAVSFYSWFLFLLCISHGL